MGCPEYVVTWTKEKKRSAALTGASMFDDSSDDSGQFQTTAVAKNVGCCFGET